MVNKIFTVPYLDRMISEDSIPDTFFECVRRYVKTDDATIGEAISEIYHFMNYEYRNEYYYKNTILNQLLIKKHDLYNTAALTELPIGDSKADFIMINGRGVVYEIRRKCIILVLFIIFSNAIIVFAVGYCMVYSFQKDLIEKNRRNKRKEPKKNLSRKHKYRWKNKDYQLIGWLLIIVAIVFYGAYVNWQGIQNAQKQELFLTTRIDNDTYIVVMTDGDEAILEKDRTGKDGKLKICKDKYMKVDCKNLLLEKKKYRRASGDGE